MIKKMVKMVLIRTKQRVNQKERGWLSNKVIDIITG